MALSSGISISSITRDGSGTVTVVTSSAHGLAANQGLSIQGSSQSAFNVNRVVKAVTNSTTFTFAQSGASLSSNSGTCFPAKQLIILETRPGDNNIVFYEVALWLTTQYPVAGGGSRWKGTSQQEAESIQSGYTIERVITIPVPGSLSVAQTKVLLQAYWSAYQNYLASATPQPSQYYGICWDGAWSV